MVNLSNITLSDNLKRAIAIAQSLSKEFSNYTVSSPHLLKALLHKEIGLLNFLMRLDQDIYYLEEWAEVRIEQLPKSSDIEDIPQGDKHFQAVIREAENIKLKLSKEETDEYCALAAICTPGVGFNYEQLKTLTLSSQNVINTIVEKSDIDKIIGISEIGNEKGSQKKAAGNALLKYCIDKNEQAIKGNLDPVVGRDNEIRRITEILGRRSKSNVLVLGDAGVGKTALINGFTQNIIDDKVPENLSEARIFELDFGSLIAGASYKGEIEDRLKNIINEIQNFDRAILFIDEIHMLLDQQSGTSGAANLLKPELSRGNLTAIGTTSIDNYTKFIESDEAFNRQFELVKLDEPDDVTTLKMLDKIIPSFEEHHKLQADQEVCEEAIRLSKRYLKERCLPDVAIDLVDHTMSGLRLMNDVSSKKIKQLKEDLEKLKPSKNKKTNISDLEWFYADLKNQISPILFSKLNERKKTGNLTTTSQYYNYCKKILQNLEKHSKNKVKKLTKSDVGAIVSSQTGIPLGKVQTKERDRLLNTEEYLKRRVIGQNHALKTISEAILESRSGLKKAGQPIGSFFFLGPTGTGKTELAKSLAEFMFQDESFLIRFDMSEFKEEHSAALLYGAPPGYVGYEEGGLLVNKIRQKPYSVVLFDEIEKAHTSVFDIFLQILDEGKLHDRLGKEGDFSNALVLFTSNIGSDFIIDSFEKGIIPKSNDLMDIMSNYFRPEFLGRLTEIVPFSPITEDSVQKIFDIHLKSLYKSLHEKGIILEIDERAKKKIAISGFNPKYGARPILGVIRNELRRPLSRMIISGQIKKDKTVKLILNKKDEVVWKII